MTEHHYDWSGGPAVIKQHSIAKHNVLRAYLARYFITLGCSPNQDVLKLTLVDGFAGGGEYTHSDTKQLVLGSPFICLDAVREAEFALNANRHKPLKLDVHCYFIEKERPAFLYLERALRDRGYGHQIGAEIHLRRANFHDEAKNIIDAIRARNPRAGRSIFILDQYGYKNVPFSLIRKIFATLPGAEVVLTFNVDSLLTYVSDGDVTQEMLSNLELNGAFCGRTIEEIKKSERHWRLFIQSGLYRELIQRCGAKHYTPFFIRSPQGHGDYWLVHMSQHHRARDVMTEVHWEIQNHFIHYGGSGLEMFEITGYDPDYDSLAIGQHRLGFEFDDVARKQSIRTLKEQFPRYIYARPDGLSFGELFASTCNGSPASAEIYRSALIALVEERVIEVVSENGAVRRSASQIRNTDCVRPPAQRSLLIT